MRGPPLLHVLLSCALCGPAAASPSRPQLLRGPEGHWAGTASGLLAARSPEALVQRANSSEVSRVAGPWLTAVNVIIIACVIAALCAAGGVWFFLRRAAAGGEDDTPSTLEEIQQLRHKILNDLDQLKQDEDAINGAVAEDKPGDANDPPGVSLTDYDTLARKVAQRVVHRVGPALAKGQAISTVVEDRLGGFLGKVKRFVRDELSIAAGSVCKTTEMEELMLLMNWNDASEANFPPAHTLVGGLLAPVILSMRWWNNVAQMVIVLLPSLLLCAWAVYMDWNNPCYIIPTLKIWLYAQTAVGVLLIFARGFMVAKIMIAQRTLRAHSDEMREKILDIQRRASESKTNLTDRIDSEVSEIKDVCISYTVSLQKALLVEDQVRRSFMHHVIGICTALWLAFAVWVFVIVLGWTFVPGTVAFHHKAADKGAYCAAWASVLTARIVCVLQVLFMFINMIVVAIWLSDLHLGSGKGRKSVTEKFEKMDDDYLLGLPALQLFARGVLFRDPVEHVSDKLAAAVQEHAKHEADLAELQALSDDLAKRLKEKQEAAEAIRSEAKQLQAASEEKADEIEGAVEGTLTQSFDAARNVDPEELKAKAQEIQEKTAEDIQRIMERISEAISAVGQSEAFRGAMEQADQARLSALERAREASAQLQDPETQARLAAMGQEAVTRGQEATRQTVAKGQEAAQQARGAMGK